MNYDSSDAFRSALEQRLRTEAQQSNASISWLRKRVAFERLLARLAKTAPQRWVLKGAFALSVRPDLSARPTKDIDLAWADDARAAEADLRAATVSDLNDFFDYEVRPIGREMPGNTIRYTVLANLAGRLFEQFPVDVASGQVVQRSELLPVSNSLEFAAIEDFSVDVILLEQHVAEKVHAYLRDRGDREKTRVKDLVDLVAIGSERELDADRLKEALTITFAQDEQELTWPPQLPAPPQSWMTSYAALAREVGASPDLEAGHAFAAQMLDPVLAGHTSGRWDPGTKCWVK